MKGLELAKGYFVEECLPRLRREIPAALPYLAAGLVGEGSECFGCDDFLSRDHDWGPAFCIWLPERKMAEFAPGIEKILAELPKEYMGLRCRSLVGAHRVGLHSIESFYASLIDHPGVPETAGQWLNAPESGLAAAVNGEVFLDNMGEFSAVRAGLAAHYPKDVAMWLLARRCAIAAQTGQYNYLRCLRHGENLAAEVIKGRFAENAAGALFLLWGRYMPFYKWSFRGLREYSSTGCKAAELMETMMAEKGMDAIKHIEEISAIIIGELRAAGISSCGSDFLMDHCPEIMEKIEDEALRRRQISLAF